MTSSPRKQRWQKAILAGNPISQVMGGNYENMLKG